MDNIIQELVDYSGKLFIIKEDSNLKMPAFSLIEYDFRRNPRNVIIINRNLIPSDDISVLAHILAHEYGHHIYEHVKINPRTLNEKQLEQIECEADFYALMFIEKYKYSKNSIIKFMIETTNSISLLKKRIDIINGNIDEVNNNVDLIKFT
jgi:Zn-dependent peptidase ImmA (M78 family)